MTDTPNWVLAMRQELMELDAIDRITATAAWTTLMTNELLAELGDMRRAAVVDVIVSWGGPREIPRLADTLGTRVHVVQRLWEEGRRRMLNR